ncbi:MAG: hypothetical protein RR825_02880, partial [Ruthenibacterium sp.]
MTEAEALATAESATIEVATEEASAIEEASAMEEASTAEVEAAIEVEAEAAGAEAATEEAPL